jgi:putative Holliday junction resolvase
MGRIIAIDYGKKRTGIAVSDPLQLIAGSLATVPSHQVIPFLLDYTAKEPVEIMLVGEPRQMDYTVSENFARTERFCKQLQKAFPAVDIRPVDERFTSVLAHQTMLEAGLKKQQRQDKALVDRISATIILQTYLESIRK